MYEFKAYINGEFVNSSNNSVVEVISPETNKVVGTVPALTIKQIKDTFLYAKKAQPQWEKLSRKERCDLLLRFADLLDSNKSFIANIMVDEIAKGPKASESEVSIASTYIRKLVTWYLNEQPTIVKENIHGIKGKTVFVEWRAYGVITAISPFNFPVNLSITKFVPALIAGNSVIFKAATNGCLVGAAITELLHKSGIPRGVFNNVTGRGADIGDELITNKNVGGVTFTGSSIVGTRIAKLRSMIPIVLELGGKSPAIVLEDADLDLAAAKIVAGAMNYSGQRCTAIKRVLVHKSVADTLTKKIINIVSTIKVGLAKDNVEVASLIDKKSADYVQLLYEDAINHGAIASSSFRRENNLIYPIVLTKVVKNMKIYDEEQFGPIIPIIEFQNNEEAIYIANDTIYGLQSSIFTKNENLAKKIANEIETGSVNLNSFPQSGPVEIPFLGVKSSGFLVQNIPFSINNMRRLFNFVVNE